MRPESTDENRERRGNGEGAEALLPPSSVLDIDDYISMLAGVSDRTRFRILYLLSESDGLDAAQLNAQLDLHRSTLYYHLSQLEDAALIHRRTQPSQTSNSAYTYHPTVFGDLILDFVTTELIAPEWDFKETYSS